MRDENPNPVFTAWHAESWKVLDEGMTFWVSLGLFDPGSFQFFVDAKFETRP